MGLKATEYQQGDNLEAECERLRRSVRGMEAENQAIRDWWGTERMASPDRTLGRPITQTTP